MTSKLIDVQEITRINISIRNMSSKFTRSVVSNYCVLKTQTSWELDDLMTRKLNFEVGKCSSTMTLYQRLIVFLLSLLFDVSLLDFFDLIVFSHDKLYHMNTYFSIHAHITQLWLCIVVKIITSKMDVDQYLWTSWKNILWTSRGPQLIFEKAQKVVSRSWSWKDEWPNHGLNYQSTSFQKWYLFIILSGNIFRYRQEKHLDSTLLHLIANNTISSSQIPTHTGKACVSFRQTSANERTDSLSCVSCLRAMSTVRLGRHTSHFHLSTTDGGK